MKKNQNGITLIALVITIIVLLILAGVSIAMLTGDNGILNQASEAADETTLAEVKEQVGMVIDEYAGKYYDEKYVDNNETVRGQNMGDYILAGLKAEAGAGKQLAKYVKFVNDTNVMVTLHKDRDKNYWHTVYDAKTGTLEKWEPTTEAEPATYTPAE